MAVEVPNIIVYYGTFSQHPPFQKSYALEESNKDGSRPFSVISWQAEAMKTSQNIGTYIQTHKNFIIFFPVHVAKHFNKFPRKFVKSSAW